MRFVLAVFLAGCQSCQVPPTPPPIGPEPPPAPAPLPVMRDAAISVDSGADGCAVACRRLRTLGCEDGKPTLGGSSCETVCRGVNASAGAARVNTTCVAAAKTCAAVGACR